MPGVYLKPVYIQLSRLTVTARVTRSLPCQSHDRQTCTIVHKVVERAANAFSWKRLRSRSLSRRHCSLAFAQLFAEVHVSVDIHHREIFECAHLKFTVSGRSKQTNKPTSIHTRVCNVVTLVWGSLRLVPTTDPLYQKHLTVCYSMKGARY